MDEKISLPSGVVLILDFDSTIVSVETLDELAKIVLADAPDRDERVAEIERITAEGMSGKIDFATSLSRRFAAIRPTSDHVARLSLLLEKSISPSFKACHGLIRLHADSIWIVSGGFKDLIVPLAKDFGISASHIYANEFIWDEARETVVGYEKDNPLAQVDGKLRAREQMVAAMTSQATVVMVGDGMTDFRVRQAGLADMFIAYGETVRRPEVTALADAEAADFMEVFAVINRFFS